MEQDRQEQMVFAPIRGDEPRPGQKPKLHDGVEAHAPALRVDFAVPRSQEQLSGLVESASLIALCRISVAAIAENSSVSWLKASGSTPRSGHTSFLGRHRDRPDNDRGHRAIEHGERRRLRMPTRRRPGALAHPLSEPLVRHGVVRHRHLDRLARSSHSPPLLRLRQAATRLSASRAAFQFQTRSS